MTRGLAWLGGVVVVLCALSVAWRPGAAAERIHGADAVYTSAELRIAWAVRKDAAEDKTEVVIRVVNPVGAFRYVSVDGSDPFAKLRIALAAGVPIGDRIDLRSPRTSFAEWPSREIHFYRTEAEWGAKTPSLTVFYLGVPDTTPEFPMESALQAYLDRAAAPAR
ncbi:MAG: hypothetical protein ACT4P2_08930 [Pseudomonadota bacterium]